MDIAGRVALVTGASSGIGRAAAVDLARRGARVAVCARRRERLEDAVAECRQHGSEARAFTCDVRDREQIRATVTAVESELGPVDILVNNAGAGAYHLFVEAPEEEFEDLMRTNYFSAVWFTRDVLPGMLDRSRGAIVFVSSFAGRVATLRHTAYAASKFAMTGLAEALYYEVKPRGVHVAVINPGVIRTELFDKGADFDHIRGVVEPNMVGPEVVTAAIAKAIERERFELFAPARYAVIWKLRTLLPGPVMKGTLAFWKRMANGPSR